jgi:hypothetical protein
MKKLLLILSIVICSPTFATSLTWKVKVEDRTSKEVRIYTLDDQEFKIPRVEECSVNKAHSSPPNSEVRWLSCKSEGVNAHTQMYCVSDHKDIVFQNYWNLRATVWTQLDIKERSLWVGIFCK